MSLLLIIAAAYVCIGFLVAGLCILTDKDSNYSLLEWIWIFWALAFAWGPAVVLLILIAIAPDDDELTTTPEPEQ